MTGELFALLAEQSVLRECVGVDTASTQKLDTQIFMEAVKIAQKNPGTIAAQLFSLRAASLLNNLPASYRPCATLRLPHRVRNGGGLTSG